MVIQVPRLNKGKGKSGKGVGRWDGETIYFLSNYANFNLFSILNYRFRLKQECSTPKINPGKC